MSFFKAFFIFKILTPKREETVLYQWQFSRQKISETSPEMNNTITGFNGPLMDHEATTQGCCMHGSHYPSLSFVIISVSM